MSLLDRITQRPWRFPRGCGLYCPSCGRLTIKPPPDEATVDNNFLVVSSHCFDCRLPFVYCFDGASGTTWVYASIPANSYREVAFGVPPDVAVWMVFTCATCGGQVVYDHSLNLGDPAGPIKVFTCAACGWQEEVHRYDPLSMRYVDGPT